MIACMRDWGETKDNIRHTEGIGVIGVIEGTGFVRFEECMLSLETIIRGLGHDALPLSSREVDCGTWSTLVAYVKAHRHGLGFALINYLIGGKISSIYIYISQFLILPFTLHSSASKAVCLTTIVAYAACLGIAVSDNRRGFPTPIWLIYSILGAI